MPFGGHQQICRSKLWFINPHYKQKFHLTPRLLPHWVWRVKYIRNFFNSKLLYLCTSNRKKASLVPKFGLHRRHIQVSIDVRRRSSMTTKIRARNEASGELKYQPSKHTKSMINYSITMRSVNTNLLIGSICHLLIVAYRPLLYQRNPRAKPFLFGFYNQRFL